MGSSSAAAARSRRLTIFFGVVVTAAICLPGLSLWYRRDATLLPALHSPTTSTTVAAGTAHSPAGPWTLDSLVDLGYIKYRGRPDEGTGQTYWGGIHYAVAPAGDMRWKEPVEIEKAYSQHTEVVEKDATQPGPACMQQLPPWQAIKAKRQFMPMSEDCLVLNVRAPTERHDESLPVLVFIHGGGYNAGNAITEDRGTHLIQESQNSMIVVETQYRLGMLGFLSSEAIREQGTANAGLLDQRAALRWVQRHIASFGGDPSRVTVMGGSAGGGSVTFHLQLFGGANDLPFRAAIPEYPWWQQFRDNDALEMQYNDLLSATGCETLVCLRGLSYDDLASSVHDAYISAFQMRRFGFGDYYFGPSIDGTVLKELPSQAYSSGNFSKVPMLITRNALEGLPFTDTSISNHDLALDNIHKIWPHASNALVSAIDGLYPLQTQDGSYFEKSPVSDIGPNTAAGDMLASWQPQVAENFGSNSIAFASAELFGDVFVNCGTKVVAKAMHAAHSPIWKAIYNSGYLVHGAFQATVLEGNPMINNVTEATILARHVISFVKHLDPNVEKSPEGPFWPAYGSAGQVLNVNVSSVSVAASDPDDGPRCDLVLEHFDEFSV